jgi:hypothetical protein
MLLSVRPPSLPQGINALIHLDDGITIITWVSPRPSIPEPCQQGWAGGKKSSRASPFFTNTNTPSQFQLSYFGTTCPLATTQCSCHNSVGRQIGTAGQILHTPLDRYEYYAPPADTPHQASTTDRDCSPNINQRLMTSCNT